MFGLRYYTFPSNLYNVTKYEIITITDIPCKCFKITPAEFSEILGIPQKSKWRRNVTKYLSKLEVGEFYKTAK